MNASFYQDPQSSNFSTEWDSETKWQKRVTDKASLDSKNHIPCNKNSVLQKS